MIKKNDMEKIERQAKGVETLTIAKCPCCNGEINVGDCGYSTFNPGWAECLKCKRKWSFNSVNDLWHAGETWNKLAVTIRKKLRILSIITVKSNFSPSRDYDYEDLEDEAKLLLEEFKELVIGADK